jgi:hypothetical protein
MLKEFALLAVFSTLLATAPALGQEVEKDTCSVMAGECWRTLTVSQLSVVMQMEHRAGHI